MKALNDYLKNKIRHALYSATNQVPSTFKSVLGKTDAIVIALVASLLVYGRWSSIVYPIALNPDEAQAAANTLRIRAYGFNWDAMDGTTVGPLNSMILSWPHFLGLDVTFSSTRLTACILLFLICTFTYSCLKKICNKWIATLFLLPLVIFYSFTESPEFLHYSSEILPLLLLVGANYLAFSISPSRGISNTFKFFFLGLLVGSVPFAKLQAFPIAMVVGVYAFFLAVTSKKWQLANVASLIFGGLSPTIIILTPLYLSGHIQDFWQSYIIWAGIYIKNSTSIAGIHSMITSDLTLTYVTYFLFCVWLASLLHWHLILRHENLNVRLASHSVLYLAALVLVIFWVIAKPGNPFPHYLMFFPPFVIIFFCSTLFSAHATQARKTAFISYYIFFSLIFVSSFFI